MISSGERSPKSERVSLSISNYVWPGQKKKLHAARTEVIGFLAARTHMVTLVRME